jgi:hypothetical protein
MASEIEILKVLKILGDIYPNFHLGSAAVEIYVQLLADIPGPLLEQAALEHIGSSAFFPAVAELRQAAFNILESVDPTPSDYEAWAEVQQEIRRVGHCGQPQFKNPLAGQAVEQLGWHSLCFSENPVADRAHFVQAYQVLAEHRRLSTHRLQAVSEFITVLQAANQPRLTGGNQEKA